MKKTINNENYIITIFFHINIIINYSNIQIYYYLKLIFVYNLIFPSELFINSGIPFALFIL